MFWRLYQDEYNALILKLEQTVVVNVYAPNYAAVGQQLWAEMAQRLPSLEHWCMIGDFNMIVEAYGRTWGNNVVVHGSEMTEWDYNIGHEDIS